jgi:DnaJ-class molecular chaperone
VKTDECQKHPKSEMYQPECDTCGGEGYKECDEDYSGMPCEPFMETCWRCGGTGYSQWHICRDCEEEYYEEELSEAEVRL